MRYPDFLKKNGKIGFIAPSFGCATPPYSLLYEKAKDRFKDWGYELVEGPNCTASNGIGKSNTPKACGEEINDFFLNDRSDVIISCGGGETMCEDLPYVDFKAISKAKPKWYLGYSDNTNLTFTLPVLADTAAVYGPCVSDFGMSELHPSLKDTFGILTGEIKEVSNYDKWESEQLKSEDNPYAPYNVTEPFSMHVFRHGKEIRDNVAIEGRLIGGCLDCLVNLIGTRFDKTREFCEKYKDDGIIWFIEACDLNVMDCRRALWQMDQAGWFKYLKGILVGRPRLYDDRFIDYGMTDVFSMLSEQFDVPVITDLDIGHLPPMVPVISGAKAQINTVDNSIRISYIFE